MFKRCLLLTGEDFQTQGKNVSVLLKMHSIPRREQQLISHFYTVKDVNFVNYAFQLILEKLLPEKLIRCFEAEIISNFQNDCDSSLGCSVLQAFTTMPGLWDVSAQPLKFSCVLYLDVQVP